MIFSSNSIPYINMLTYDVFVIGRSLSHVYPSKKKRNHFYLKAQFVPRRKHFPSQ